jgi:hypothetical protein
VKKGKQQFRVHRQPCVKIRLGVTDLVVVVVPQVFQYEALKVFFFTQQA